jgi:tRNA-binding protein
MRSLTWNEFEQVELRVGTVIDVQDFPEARQPAYKLEIDFGAEIGVKQSSAQITHLYSREELLARQVIAVINFPPKQIGHYMSECLVTGFYNAAGQVILAVPERPVDNGSKLL